MTDLENSKVGDTVYVETPWRRKLAKISEITPKGLLKIDDQLFYKSGLLRTSEKYNTIMAYAITPEEKEQIMKDFFVGKVKNKMLTFKGELTYEESKIIYDIIKDKE